jgi:outer membrane lipoprotein-sorting protein
MFIFAFSVFSQDELLSAKELLKRLSDRFRSEVKDFQADIKWVQGDLVQTGKVMFKNPMRLKITFKNPSGQVICSNGYDLWIYVPSLSTTLHQKLLEREHTDAEDGKVKTVINPILLNPVGLDRFLNNYTVEYIETKKKIPYKDTNVYKFKLIRWESSKAGFNTIILTVQENGIIRKIEGTTASYRNITLEIDNIEKNISIGDTVFNYVPPGNSQIVDDFIINQGKGR